MKTHAVPPNDFSLEQVLRLRGITREISKFFDHQLRTYLDTLNPLFRPRRILGDFIEGSGREGGIDAEGNFKELTELFENVSERPIELTKRLAKPIESISTHLQIYPWEYLHEISDGPQHKKITVKAPLTWVVCFPSPYSLPLFRQVIAGTHSRDQNHVAAFVLRACVMSVIFKKLQGLTTLIEGLRYHVEIRKSPELGELPLITVSAPVRSVLPSDNIVLLASGVSGGDSFEEIIEPDTVRNMSDPLREQILALLEPKSN